MRARLGILGAVALAAAAPLPLASPASAAHSYPATYSGSVAGGGLVEFDVSADGAAITRFKVTDVPTECGTITTELTGSVPIADHAFSRTTGPLMFSGSFPATQTAQGSVQYRQTFPSCTSTPRSWNATTTAPPPGPSPTPTPTPAPTPVPDTTPPVVTLSGRTTQVAGRTVAVGVTSGKAGSARATGTVVVPRPGRTAARFALRPASAQLAARVRAQLRLGVPSRARVAIRRALRSRRRVSATVKVTVRDAAGNATVKRRTIRLR